jgi:allantoin racemase
VQASYQAVCQDGAAVIVPGCTGLAGLAPRFQAGLRRLGCEALVLDPPSVAMKFAEILVGAGLSHSPRSYAQPNPKLHHWPWEILYG